MIISNLPIIFGRDIPKIYQYIDFGFKGDFGKGVFVDLSFVRLTDDLKNLRQTPDDVVIPFVRLGFNHNIIGLN